MDFVQLSSPRVPISRETCVHWSSSRATTLPSTASAVLVRCLLSLPLIVPQYFSALTWQRAQFLRQVVHSGSDSEADSALGSAVRLAAAAGSLTQHVYLALLLSAYPLRVRPWHLRTIAALCSSVPAAGPAHCPASPDASYTAGLVERLEAGGAISPSAVCAAVLSTLDALAMAGGPNEAPVNAANTAHIVDGAAVPALLDLLDVFTAAAPPSAPEDFSNLAWDTLCRASQGDLPRPPHPTARNPWRAPRRAGHQRSSPRCRAWAG